MGAAIKPMTSVRRITGLARTVRCVPGDYLTLLKGLAEAREGEVLVVDGGGMMEAALVGKIMDVEARRKGVAGFVVDGVVRDLAGLEALGVPVFARGATPRPGTAERLLETQVPIICGGAPVRPGDLVHGDDDGVVVVPAKRLREVAVRALEIERHDAEVERKIRRGRPLAEVTKLLERVVELRKRG
jgi:regulator of RNase E activity RraA